MSEKIRPVAEAKVRLGFAKDQYRAIMDAYDALGSAKREAQGGEQRFQDGTKWRYKVANADRHLVTAYTVLRAHFESRASEKEQRIKRYEWKRVLRNKMLEDRQHG